MEQCLGVRHRPNSALAKLGRETPAIEGYCTGKLAVEQRKLRDTTT